MTGWDMFLQSGRNWHKAAIEEQEMLLAASEVIMRRSWQMMTGRMSAGEATRMLVEKPMAFAVAAQEAGEAAARLSDPGYVAMAAVQPLHHEALRNAHRLRG